MREWQLSLRRDIAEIGRAAAWLEGVAAEAGWPDSIHFRLDVCFEEVLANVIKHGGGGDGEILVSLSGDKTGVSARIEDDGPAFDSTMPVEIDRPQSLETAQVGGWGLHLTQRLTSEMHYSRDGARNRLTMLFRPEAG